MQTITAGTAVVSVDGLERTLATGERIEIAANQRFMFINRGRREWRFSARHPMWEPNTFFYEIDGREIPGDGLWFELKLGEGRGAAAHVQDPVPGGPGDLQHRCGGAGCPDDPPAQHRRSQHRERPGGQGRARDRAGRGGGTRGDAPGCGESGSHERPVRRGQSEPGCGRGGDPAGSPRFWNPKASFWELTRGRFSSGDKVWFEYVLPA